MDGERCPLEADSRSADAVAPSICRLMLAYESNSQLEASIGGDPTVGPCRTRRRAEATRQPGAGWSG